MRVLLGIALALLAVALPKGNAQASGLTVNSAPEITFDIPNGWVACDAETSAKLQGPTPAGRMAALCAAFDETGGARMVGTPDGTLVLSFAINGPTVFPPDIFRSMTPEKVSARSAALCQSTLQIPPGGPTCVFALETVASRSALVGHVKTPNGQFEVARMMFIPGKTRSAIFNFLASPPSSDNNARIDAIVASIRVAE